ncbi:hypothetical protein OF83DRAFT_1083873 [Amylostereum chailletii]|nr:hypothetical protein OF83DRAFT_1083873 [Amylostereum chailletii]
MLAARRLSNTLTRGAALEALRSSPSSVEASSSARMLHSTARVAIADRAPPGSVPPGADPDLAVPRFYIERKRQRDSIEDRKEEEGGLMHELSAGLLADDVAATTRIQPNKVPTEHAHGGFTIHPSGFVVPTPGEAIESYADRRTRDIAQQTAAVAERVSEHDDLTNFQWDMTGRDEKVPFEVFEKDGTISHPSGFVPPTPAHAFHGATMEHPGTVDVTFRESTGPAASTPWKQ